MKVVMLQTDISWARPDVNIRHARQLMDNAQGGDLYVLPEMWSTGFIMQPEGIACNIASNEALRGNRRFFPQPSLFCGRKGREDPLL